MTAATAPDPAAAPRCGVCGYDTTGLTSLTCPECGADLRLAGINRGRPTQTLGRFFASALALLLAWVVCGMLLANTVSALVPYRQIVQQTTRLGGPNSRAYKDVTVVATGSGWADERPVMRVDLQLVPLPPGKDGAATASAAGAVPSQPPKPLAASNSLTTDDVLKWFASSGIDTADPRVRDEAESVALAVARVIRSSGRRGASFGWGASTVFGSSTTTGGMGGPFASISSSVRGSTSRSNLATPLLGSLWVAALVVGVVFLWRTMRPRTTAAGRSH